MWKRAVLAMIAVFVAWSVLDFVIHGVILGGTYAVTPELWRPMEEMKTGLMYGVGVIAAVCFVAIYAWLIQPKSVAAGVKYGALFGLCTGISMGYGTYSVMPIPYTLALGWFLGSLVELILAGLLVGWIVKSPDSQAPIP